MELTVFTFRKVHRTMSASWTCGEEAETRNPGRISEPGGWLVRGIFLFYHYILVKVHEVNNLYLIRGIGIYDLRVENYSYI